MIAWMDLLKVKNVTTKSVGLLREYWKARKAGNEEKEDDDIRQEC